MLSKPELLVPVKNFSNLKAGINYGDAFYFGTSMLNMRYKASLELKEIKKMIDYIHDHNKKAYITVNNIMYEYHLKTLDKVMENLKSINTDAVIVSDLAAIDSARNHNLDIHVSTQANISNSRSVNMYKQMGATRVVLARELSLKSIKEIKRKTDIEIETFIHGAMCMAISGRCYLSLYLTGRNANLGTCSHECRRQYKLTDIEEPHKEIITDGKYFMNSKDLKTIDFLPNLIEAKIDSFKIEGRNRDQYYVNTVAKVYREGIDAYFNNTFTKKKLKEWNKELLKVFNRGYTSGFYFGNPGINVYNHEKSNNNSEYRKLQMARVLSIDIKNSKETEIKIKTFISGLKIHDAIYIMNNNEFVKAEITSIKLKSGKETKELYKGDLATITIRIKEGDIDINNIKDLNVYLLKKGNPFE